MKSLLSVEHVERRIYLIRGQRVMLDSDLATLYTVTTGALNRAVKRNAIRFPPDFMFHLTHDEAVASRCQIGTMKRGQNIKYLPSVFTEQGVAMLSGVLKSQRAALVNIAIMRAFVRIRQILASNQDLARRMERLEGRHAEHDENFRTVFAAIRELQDPPKRPRRRIGSPTCTPTFQARALSRQTFSRPSSVGIPSTQNGNSVSRSNSVRLPG